jgi:thymidylate synthase (FAD)
MIASLVHITPDIEKQLVYIARVSSPKSQEAGGNEDKLLSYMIRHGHWSPFEMGSLCIEINTNRAIARQILRHRSFHFQELSQRYQDVSSELENVNYNLARRQDTKNRQNSIDDLPENVQLWWLRAQEEIAGLTLKAYKQALAFGVAKECARSILPEGLVNSRMYMSGTVRSWIHYISTRTDETTQKEHREVALAIKAIFIEQLPITAKALGWL